MIQKILAHLSIISLVISIISTIIAILSFRRAKRYQDFDYSPRLQIEDEKGSLSSPSFSTAFSYSAKVKNAGLKPIKIDNISVDYGSRDDPKKRIRHHIEGQFYLSPGEFREIQFKLSRDDMESTMQKLEIHQCMFFLHFVYCTATEKKIETGRWLGGYDENMPVFTFQSGVTLT
jgi:hypothetical protein